ncbi:MAG: F-type H+-transporting ATPase subunit delta [Bradymonadia bacterium]|jgi:F-type H+-transporting ATPase subunit delta
MAKHTVAAPYAKALLGIAVEQGALRPMREQLEGVANLIVRSKELRSTLSNPTVTPGERMKVIDVVATRLAVSKTLRNFLFLLSDRNRLSVVIEINEEFGRLADVHLGVLRAEAVSSEQLSVTQMTRLKNTLAEKTGKTVLVTNRVDASLLGGLQVKVAGKIYDASVKTRLRQLREAILNDL